MCYVDNNGCFVAVSTDDTKEGVYYIMKFTSGLYTLLYNVIIYWMIILMVEQVSKYHYLNHLIQGYKWYADPPYGKS